MTRLKILLEIEVVSGDLDSENTTEAVVRAVMDETSARWPIETETGAVVSIEKVKVVKAEEAEVLIR